VPIYDFRCPSCSIVTEEFVPTYKTQTIICPECGCEASKLFPDTMRFELKYNNKKDKVGWSNDGYASTRYYEATDAQCKNNIFDQKVKETK
jgi:putative FmdB family regulatory protein